MTDRKSVPPLLPEAIEVALQDSKFNAIPPLAAELLRHPHRR